MAGETASNFGGGCNYKFVKIKAIITLSITQNISAVTEFAPASTRTIYNLSLRQTVYKGVNIYFDLGNANYINTIINNNYKEKYLNGGLTYNF